MTQEALDAIENADPRHVPRWAAWLVAATFDPAERYIADNRDVDRSHISDALAWRFGGDGALVWRRSRIDRIRRRLVAAVDGCEDYASDQGLKFFRVVLPDGLDTRPFVAELGERRIGLTFLGVAPDLHPDPHATKPLGRLYRDE